MYKYTVSYSYSHMQSKPSFAYQNTYGDKQVELHIVGSTKHLILLILNEQYDLRIIK